MAFFIEKIVASGAGKKESTIVFKPGANIIYGPSNTGKTYIVKCIDFLFGSDADPFDSSSGYDSISIYLKTRGGQVVMHRKLGSNKIDVSSTDPSISNGKYTAKASGKNYEKTINSVWLALIGITEQHSINKNERSQKQVLSWRTFCHMFMLTETKIISETSIFLPDRGYSDTSALSALLFLLWGKDFSDTEAIESKEIKDAKKDAIKTYINQELFKISERNQELTAFLSELSTTDINQEIESLMTQVTENEQRISEAIDENKRILQSLHEKNDALSECNVLINRYQELTTQYGADLKRLSFIVDAYLNSAVAIVLSRYMQKHAHYAPGLILLDSPILSLKEIDTQKPSQSMRNGLFENIASTSEGIQTIVIENEIPEIDYSNVNLIHFTKNANTGRYGFLIDVMD